MKKMKVLVFAMMMLLLAACGNGEKAPEASGDATAETGDKIVFKLSNVFNTTQPLNVTLEEVAQNVKERTNGAIEIQIYGNGEIATYKDGIEQVRNGAYFMSNEDPSYMGDWVPEFNALVGPMLYDSMEEYSAMCHSEYAEELMQKAYEQGMKVLALDYGFGFRHICGNKPYLTPEDLKGVKLRVPKSNLWIQTLTAMGATPVPQAWSEVYASVQQGVVDGLETSISDIADNKMGAIIKDISLTGHFCGTTCVVMSAKVWDQLTEEQQKILWEEFQAGAIRNNKRVAELEEKDRKDLEAEGVKFHEVDKTPFRENTKVVFDQIENLPAGTYDRIQEELTKIRNH